MAIGFHLDDIEEAHLLHNYYDKPIGAPIHDDDDYNDRELPPIGAPIHDDDYKGENF